MKRSGEPHRIASMKSRATTKPSNSAEWLSDKRKEAEVRKHLYGHRFAPIRIANPRGTLR